jgi:hypothetical protein
MLRATIGTPATNAFWRDNSTVRFLGRTSSQNHFLIIPVQYFTFGFYDLITTIGSFTSLFLGYNLRINGVQGSQESIS